MSQIFPSGWEIHNERLDPGIVGDQSVYAYRDIRDDRVYTFFDINQGEIKNFKVLLNASYLGRFYLLMVSAEVMYDATKYARIPGRWINIIKPGTRRK